MTPVACPARRPWTRTAAALGFACGLLLTVPACHIPGLRQADPIAGVPAAINGTTTPESSAQLRVEEYFDDPMLTGLIREALANNRELKSLAEDIQIANNEVLARRGAILPFASLRAGVGFDKSSKYTRSGAVDEQLNFGEGRRIPNPLPDFLVSADVTWQVDIWRKLRNARDAAALRYLATAEGRTYVGTRLAAEVAENYYTLLALDKRMETLDEIIKLQEQSLEVAKAKKEAGGAGNTELPVQRFKAEVRRNQSEKLIVKQEIVERENRINVLAGRFPQPVARASAGFLDLNPKAVSVGMPGQLLLNRPDLRQADRELQAAGLDVQVARAEFLPSLNLTAGVGFDAFKLQYLFRPDAFVANAAAGLVTPLVNRTAIQALYATANARQLQAAYSYQRVVLDAFSEVVNRVSAADNYRKSGEVKKEQLQALEASVEVATQLYKNAKGEYADVLFSQRDLVEARTVLIETKRLQMVAVVNAYQALGGGTDAVPAAFGPPPPATPAPPPALVPPNQVLPQLPK